jgi:calcineurin-like phosphoesterase family protein
VIFFTSDTHFGHKNIIKYSNRPFSSVEEMNRIIIENWNKVVNQKDDIYHLGDFGLTNTNEIVKILKRLNGKKYLIRGNHDKEIRGDALGYFQWIKDYYQLKYRKNNGDKQMIVLCHYGFEVWNNSHHGSYHLHGHSHGSLFTPNYMRRLDVGVDVQGFQPISIEKVEKHMEKKIWKSIDHHGADR